MPNIPITSAMGYVGVFLLLFGAFLIISGIGILKIEKVTIMSGKKTWATGVITVLVGVLFLLPEISNSMHLSANPRTVTLTFESSTVSESPITSPVVTLEAPPPTETQIPITSSPEVSTPVMVQGIEPDQSTAAYELAVTSNWQVIAENLLAQMTTQVTYNTHAGESDHVISEDDQMTKRFVGEKERIEVKPNHCATWWSWGGENTGPRFSAQQDWQLIKGPENAQEGYGMMVRVNDNSQSHYQFGIRDKEQQFDIEYWLHGNAEILQDWKFSDAIRHDQVNRIGVVADGGQFYFLINGIVVAELNDNHTKDGVIGSYFDTCDKNNLTIFETDNFELRKP
jgi:hypothetical protein